MALLSSITRRYHFEAAHFLPLVPDGHKCKRMHGHNYEFELVVRATLNDQGWVLDFWDLDLIVQPLINEKLDHRLLNEVPGLDNPTAEIIAIWLHRIISNLLPTGLSLDAVHVYETKDCRASAHSTLF
jgi:6-pyruvoyltetrahydropterin/6-carboxytetrahydropterin synthase